MVQVTAALVKDLRERTGAGMMDCKQALGEVGGDIEAAVDWLRRKGLAAAQKKAGRVAAEGLVGMAIADGKGALVELNAETDFVARNEGFQKAVSALADLGLRVDGDLEALKAADMGGGTAGDHVANLIATIGENMTLRRYATLSVGSGVVSGYVHNAVAPGLGRIGVLVGLESEGDAGRLAELGRLIAMHVAAAGPRWVSRDVADAEAVEREREVLAAQARDSGRPDNVIGKMVEGRMRKFFEESVLLEQAYIRDTDKSVGKVLDEAAAEVGAPVACSGFLRFTLGEGVERDERDFAAEVAETLKG